jgi:hypothetical protein
MKAQIRSEEVSPVLLLSVLDRFNKLFVPTSLVLLLCVNCQVDNFISLRSTSFPKKECNHTEPPLLLVFPVYERNSARKVLVI